MYLNDQVSGLSRPHVTGEAIQAFGELNAAISAKDVGQAQPDSAGQASIQVSDHPSRKASLPSNFHEDEIEGIRMLRFHRKAER